MVHEVPQGGFINGIVDSEKGFHEKDKDRLGLKDDQFEIKEIILP